MSGACCSLPPVQSNYTPKGSYSDVAGLKSYIVGSPDSKAAVIFIYDIFGYTPQILQGADLIASQGFKVVMPDFLQGDYATSEMFSGSDEGNKQKEAYFKKLPQTIPGNSKPVANVIKALKQDGIKVGTVGACWGYKVAISSEGASDLDAIAGIHPSFAAEDDGDKIGSPLALLASKDENKEVMEKIKTAVDKKNSGKNLLKFYPEMQHGWMAARGSVDGGNATEKFADGYETLTGFFKEHLQN